MDNRQIAKVLRGLRKQAQSWKTPVVIQIGKKPDPFQVLISCLISLRTRDPITEEASIRLFALAKNPKRLADLGVEEIEQAVYPAAFYRNKARTLKALGRQLCDEFEGKVPDSMEALLGLKGVGRKTANLTLILGFDKPGICVDTHVHRICGRWGYIQASTADETEGTLRKNLPKRYWKEFNFLLVALGQNCCRPISPLCSSCCVSEFCPKLGVTRHR